MTVLLRTPNRGEERQLARVFVAAWRSGYPGIVPNDVLAGLDEATVAGWFAEWASDGGLTTVVAEADGRTAGFARYGDDPEDADRQVGYLAALYVHPEFGGAGIGRRLLQHALAEFRLQGRRCATLWVFRENARARGLYSSAGFAPDGATVTDPRWRTAQVRMRRLLDAPATEARHGPADPWREGRR